MIKETTILTYKVNKEQRNILEKVAKQFNQNLNIVNTDIAEDIIAVPSFIAFINLENEPSEDKKEYVLNCVKSLIEYRNSIIINEETFENEEKLQRLIEKNFKEYNTQTSWDKFDDDYYELAEKIKIYQKEHSLEKDDYTFSELDLTQFFDEEWPHIRTLIINSIKREILLNKLLDYIDFNRKHISPISYNTINKSILNLFIDYNTLSPYSIHYEDEKKEKENPRTIEIKQLAKLCDILAEEIYIGKYDKNIGNHRIEALVRNKKDINITDEHLIACRLSQNGVFYNLMQYIKEIIKMYFSKIKDKFSEDNLFMYKFDEKLWEDITTFIKEFYKLQLWRNRELAQDVFFGTSPAETWKEIFETGKTKDGIQVLENIIDITKILNK